MAKFSYRPIFVEHQLPSIFGIGHFRSLSERNYRKHYGNPKTFSSCIDGDLLKTGKFIYTEKVKRNYTGAENFCSRLGLQVLMPQSIEENDQPEF